LKLTICYVTSRPNNKIEWFFDSLKPQILASDEIDIVVVDLMAHTRDTTNWPSNVKLVEPKPNVWQGRSRVTAKNWWAVSNARNTGLCYCKNEWIVWIDDRCFLAPTWLDAVRHAVYENYAVCGSYEKWWGMEVSGGVITNQGTLSGKDQRASNRGVQNCYGQFWGATYVVPVEWALQINGFEELVDSLGAEDYLFGSMLCNNGFPTKYNPLLKIIEDRTPEEIGPDMLKTDKGVSPNDKSHAALHRFGPLTRTQHPWDLRAIRESVLRGEPFPNTDAFPRHDWYDNQPISAMDEQ